MSLRRWLLVPLLGAAVTAAGCDTLFGSDESLVPESELTFIRVAADAPPLADTVVSFYVKKGEAREAQIRYLYENGYGKCLLFRVPAEAPLRRPDGRSFAPGDSALVTIRIVDKGQFRFEFAPSGLRFDPEHPAVLEVRHSYADPDHNGDGTVDAADAAIEQGFGFWRQERPGEKWQKIETSRHYDLVEAHAQVTGFTIYALAID